MSKGHPILPPATAMSPESPQTAAPAGGKVSPICAYEGHFLFEPPQAVFVCVGGGGVLGTGEEGRKEKG